MSVPEQTMAGDQRRRWASWLRLWPIGLLIATGVGAFWVGEIYRHEPSANGGLVVEEKNLDFGEVREQKAFTWEISLANPTGKTVKILRFFSSCICQKVEPESLIISPGSKGKVRLVMDLTHYKSDQETVAVRDFKVNLIPLIEGKPLWQKGWNIRGKVCASLSASPRKVDFGNRLVRGIPFSSETVKINSYFRIPGLIANANPFLAISLVQSKDRPNQFDLNISPLSTIPTGPFHFEVSIKPLGKNEKGFSELVIPVEGILMDEVQGVPGRLLLGAYQIGQIITDTIILEQVTEGFFEIDKIYCASDDLAIVGSENNLSVGKPIPIRQRIAHLGYQESQVFFSVKKKGGSRIIMVAIPVIYYGLSSKEQ